MREGVLKSLPFYLMNVTGTSFLMNQGFLCFSVSDSHVIFYSTFVSLRFKEYVFQLLDIEHCVYLVVIVASQYYTSVLAQ